MLSDGLPHVSVDGSPAPPADGGSYSDRASGRRAADGGSGDGAYAWKIGWTRRLSDLLRGATSPSSSCRHMPSMTVNQPLDNSLDFSAVTLLPRWPSSGQAAVIRKLIRIRRPLSSIRALASGLHSLPFAKREQNS